MKTIIVIALTLLSTAASAAPCRMQAAAQKLTGQAQGEFMRRCTANAQAQCEQTAMQRYQMAGAARNSFIDRCVKEAVGG
jgi:hypothetical protein